MDSDQQQDRGIGSKRDRKPYPPAPHDCAALVQHAPAQTRRTDRDAGEKICGIERRATVWMKIEKWPNADQCDSPIVRSGR